MSLYTFTCVISNFGHFTIIKNCNIFNVNSSCKNNLFSISKVIFNVITLISVFVLQVDLEPEGKVYILVTLTGTFIEGKSVLSHLHSASFLSVSLSFK